MIKDKGNRILISITIVFAITLLTTLITNRFIEDKIETAIKDLPKSIKLDYADVNFNIWTGNLELKFPQLTVLGKTTDKTILNAKLNVIEIKDVSYYDYLVNNEVTIDEIVLDQLVVKYKHNPKVKNDQYSKGILDNLKQIIKVDKIVINNADVLVLNSDTDSTLLSIPTFNFELKGLQINPRASKIEKRIKYVDFNLNAEKVKYAINKFDGLFADSILITNTNATFKDFKIKTKYNKIEYSKILKTERDHFNLKIKELKFQDTEYGLSPDKKVFFKSEKVKIISPEAEIYRDKLVADDTTYKPLYGTMLRDLSFELGLNSVEISNGKISYLEKVNSEKPAGQLGFKDIEATIFNLGNINQNEQTEIKVSSTFMENSALKVNWNFKVADITDHFEFKADLGLFSADQLDQFTKANLNVDLNGELEQTYFTISANKELSRVDLKMKYEDFEVAILKKNGKEKNRFLSNLINLIVSNNSEEQKNKFRYGQDKQVERDVSKSVFNFVWLNVKQGLLTAMTGDGLQKE
ncbi:hypothetical protein [uncultured Winogradskyella sp.]|uniref:hypothetical protein n=1 Tax=uncultured Winogradskyella sp. TaxID=395353 RepID=UPI00260F462A|nr:hypothetical protein [uncultured Winogradskyella sp.]